MVIVGLFITLLGFIVAVGSLGMAGTNATRLVIVLVGTAISLGGILGVLNPAYMKDAIWKK